MKSFRENPEGEESINATIQHSREVFAINQQIKREMEDLKRADREQKAINQGEIPPYEFD